MNPQEAKRILLLYRPSVDAEAPEFADAKALAAHDPELRTWFEAHCAFQQGVSRQLRSLPAAESLRDRILAEGKIVRPAAWWQRPAIVAAAALVIGLLILAAALLRTPGSAQFAQFQGRMIGSALREYRMDVVTKDMAEVRRFMAERQAPEDFELPDGLRGMEVAGGGFLRWQNNPVAMVCFYRPNKQMVYLFVVRTSTLRDPPPQVPRREQVREITTANWSRGGNSYVLVSPGDETLKEKYF